MDSETYLKQIKYLIENFNEPAIFSGFIRNWKILQWSLEEWEIKLNNEQLQFRKNFYIKSKSPIWEQNCSTIHMTMKEFIAFLSIQNNDYCVYFDYKNMDECFKNHTDILEDISWSEFGFPEKSGKDSTIWIGSKGAHTPCHMDTYGCNLIAQVYGRKRWIIFPPEENLNPTRVPYEESSIYSKLNFFCPNVNNFKGINNARTVILNPGDVLFLPPGWWHYVENLETAISVNVWLPLPQDDRKRVEEAFTQLFISQLAKELNQNEQTVILNPNSTDIPEIPLSNSLNLLDKVIEICKNQELHKKRKTNEINSSATPFNIDDILKESDDIKTIPKLSETEFLTLLKEQETKYFTNSEVRNVEEKSCNSIIEKIINSVCHPEVLSIIVDKLLKD